jgi:hypothetical protein
MNKTTISNNVQVFVYTFTYIEEIARNRMAEFHKQVHIQLFLMLSFFKQFVTLHRQQHRKVLAAPHLQLVF